VLLTTVAPLQSWVKGQPWLSPQADRTGLEAPAHSVLVVDDDRGVRQLTARMLRHEGYEVLEAESAAEALQVLESGPEVGLVVTDIVMPGMHGLELADRVLARARSPRVVLMTGHAAELSGQLEQRNPQLPILLKPFTSEQLLGAVRRALGQARH
jgi:two-component system cell cycle sensor histidine kinase/response regulator CckA